MDASTPIVRAPRRFRTRLLVVLIGAGALAVVASGVVGAVVIDKFLAISLAPVTEVLDRVDRDLSGDAALADDVREAQVYLLQTELARRSLANIAPLAFAVTLAVVLLALVVIAARLSRRLSIPIEQLADGMVHYENGDLSYRVPEPASAPLSASDPGQRPPASADDELAFLLRRFNQMGQQLESQRARLQLSEELAAWQDVARALAHELKNPLTAMKMAVARTTRALTRIDIAAADADALRDSMQLLDQEMDVLIRMTKSFSAFAKLPRPNLRTIDLAAVLAEIVALYQEGAPVAIETEFDPSVAIPTRGDPDQLHAALGNLVKNAIEASRADSGPVRIAVTRAGDALQVVIRDDGRGIAEPISGGALTRSLGSTKPEGSGLGLPIAHKIIHEHGGSLALEPGPQGGCRALVTLPAGGADAAVASAAPTAPTAGEVSP
ncbi:MAG: hypothetical protein Tsb0020_27230 [Haliangiales bacterium]